MFTGLIEEVGAVKALKPVGASALEVTIEASSIPADIKLGDSININGACQTAVAFGRDWFTVNTVEETVKKTSLAQLRVKDNVNLERSVTPSTRLGGHFVQGHVDTTGKVSTIRKLQGSNQVEIVFDRKYSDLVVDEGSIAVDGISLTVARAGDGVFMVSIIPHTFDTTTLKFMKTGSVVNLEFDILGKYIARMLKSRQGISEDFLRSNGFM